LKLLVVIESYDVHFWVEELSNFTYTARQQRELVVCSVKECLNLAVRSV